MASYNSESVTPPMPDAVITSVTRNNGAISPRSSSSTSSSDSETDSKRRTYLDRPRLSPRQPSGSIIVPKSKAGVPKDATYPPTDARAMSPRRDSADIQRLGREARQSLHEQAKTLQSSLAALADRIDEVKSDHDKLENENKFLQEYIGGLTRTVSKGDISLASGSKSKKGSSR